MRRAAPSPVPAAYKAARPHAPALSNLTITDAGGGAYNISCDARTIKAAGWPLQPFPQFCVFYDLTIDGVSAESGPLNTNLTFLSWTNIPAEFDVTATVNLTLQTPLGNSAPASLSGPTV